MTDIHSLQSKLISLYITTTGYYPYNTENPSPISDDEIKVKLPIIFHYFVKKSNHDWSQTFSNLSTLISSDRYLRVAALCTELLQCYQEYHNQARNDITKLDPKEIVFYQLALQFLHLFTITPETILEYTLKLIALASPTPEFTPTSSNPLLQDESFKPFFQPGEITQPLLLKSTHYNLSLLSNIFTSSTQPFPLSYLLEATLCGQFEIVQSLVQLPTVDINSRCFILPITLRKMVDERVYNAVHLPEIYKPTVPGMNPATVPFCPNKLLPCPPFPWDTVSTYVTTRLMSSSLNFHNNNNTSLIPTQKEQKNTQPSTQFTQKQQTAPTPLLQSYELMFVYYHVMNQYGTCLYAASNLVNGTSNRDVTKRQKLIQRDPVLYATEDSDYYPPAPPSEESPWFFPPSSPTSLEVRSQQRSNSNFSRSPNMRWVYVAPGGNWRILEDEEALKYRFDPETKSGTYLYAAPKQPRTLFTDAMDLVTFLIKSGGEIILPLATVQPTSLSQQQHNEYIKAQLIHQKNGTFFSPLVDQNYVVTVPIPISIQDTLPNNALTTSARIAVRLGLVRYQRWCNNATNMLLDAFMGVLGFDRIKSHAYNKYNGHHWPYAYLKKYKNGPDSLTIKQSIGDMLGLADYDEKVLDLSEKIEKKPNEVIPTPLQPTPTTQGGKKQTKQAQPLPPTPTPIPTPLPPINTNLNGPNKNGIIRDITRDSIYQTLFSLVLTTRTTQIKLGIQEVPTAVSYNPHIPTHISRLVHRYKRMLKATPTTTPAAAATTTTKGNANKEPVVVVEEKEMREDIIAGSDEGENDDNFADIEENPLSVLNTPLDPTTLGPNLSELSLPSRTHLPTTQLPQTLSLLHWFFSYYYTSKHFAEIAKKATPKGYDPNSSKKSKPSTGPSFGKPVSCSVRRELDFRNNYIKAEEEKYKQELIRESAINALLDDTTVTTAPIPVAPPKKERPQPKAKPVKMSQADLDDIMGPSSKKKKKVVPPKKGAVLEPEPIPEVVIEASPIAEPEGVQDTSTITQNNTTFVEKKPLSGPDFDQELILDQADFPKPLLFNNFYDSDDNLPLLMTLSRYHGNATAPCEQGDQSQQPQVEGAFTSPPITTTPASPTTQLPPPRCKQPSFELKKQIDYEIVSPYFQTAPMVEKLLMDSYQSAASTLDPYTRLFKNQLVLGSTGYVSMDWMTPEEAEAKGIVIQHDGIKREENDEKNERKLNGCTTLNPIFTKPINDKTTVNTTAKDNIDTINLIDNDHFLTKEMSQALEMSSVLSSLVMLYCGQNTHRGYTDLQYQVKIGQPVTQLK